MAEQVTLEIALVQRNEFAWYIVRAAVAMGLVDGDQPYDGAQVAFLATTLIERICETNKRHNAEYAAERQACLDKMPKLIPL